MNPGTCLACAIAFALTTVDASAHHSFAPFDMDKRVTMMGILTKVDWRNPHIEIVIDVKSNQGAVVSWSIEGGPPARFKDYGVSRDTFAKAIGLMVTVEAGLARDGSPSGHMQTIAFPDGTTAAAR